MMRFAAWSFLSLTAVFGILACDDDPVEPRASLQGTWNLVGFSDAGIEADITGTAVFRADGTFSIAGEVTFPDEPTDAVLVEGAYSPDAESVDLTVDSVTTTWTMDFTGSDRVVLTQLEPPPANSITLERA